MAKRKGGPIVKTERVKIIQTIADDILDGKVVGVPKYKLAKKYGFAYETFVKLLDEAYQQVPVEKVEQTYKQFQQIFNRLFYECYNMLDNPMLEPRDRVRVISEVRSLINDKTKLLEAFFIKMKAPENVNMHVDGIDPQRLLDIEMEMEDED